MTEQEVTKVLDEHRIPPAELLERIRYVLSTRRSLLAMLGELSVQSDPASDPQALETVKQVRARVRGATSCSRALRYLRHLSWRSGRRRKAQALYFTLAGTHLARMQIMINRHYYQVWRKRGEMAL